MDFRDMTEEQLIEFINRRRRQVLTACCAYYMYDDNLISDHEYDRRVHELLEIQDEYPWIADKCIYSKEFSQMEGCGSGYNLPYKERWVVSKTLQLIRYRNSQNLI